MRGGVLGSPESIKFAVCYCVAQAMMVSFLIASMYRCAPPRPARRARGPARPPPADAPCSAAGS